MHISSYPTAVALDLASDDTPRLAFLTGGDSLGLPDDRLGYFAVGGSTPTVKGWWPVDWATAPPSGLALAVDDSRWCYSIIFPPLSCLVLILIL